MKLIHVKLIVFVFLTTNTIFSQETFKLMFYNVLNYPLQEPASRIQNLEVIIDDYLPDLFMICELNNETGADNILNILQDINPNYSRANFVNNTSDDSIGDQNDLQNMIFYDSTKFILNSQTEITTLYRDFNHYTLTLNTVDQLSNPIVLNVFVCHLKSSSGTDNQNLRFQMVQDFTDYLATMPDDSYVILGGDFNFYTNSEPGFQELIDATNNITLVDPAGRIGSWHNNLSYLDVFTQSTRTQSGLGGATGGFDDRFDFIMASENILSNPDIYYVNGSYQVYGNNNNPNCFNSEIYLADCEGVEFSSTIRNALYYMSDHLPVTLELQTNETLSNLEYTLNNAIEFKNGNISSDNIVLKINDNTLVNQNITILNYLGQRINSQQIEGQNEMKIDVSNISSGIYYIVLENVYIKPLKFIKN